MSVVVLDTTVASLLYSNRPDVALYKGDLVGATPALAFQTVAEMHVGAELRGWSRRRRATLRAFLASYPRIDVSDDVVDAWVTAMAASQRQGRALDDSDAWIAACAMSNGVPLITHDADFRGLKVPGLDVVCRAP